MSLLPLAKRSLVVGLAASLCAHLICAALLYRLDSDPAAATGAEPILVDFDIHEAPEAPAADMPADDPQAPVADPEEANASETDEPAAEQIDDVAPIPPPAPPEDVEDPIAVVPIDAGVPDASALADNRAWDAGVSDAGATEVASAELELIPEPPDFNDLDDPSDAGASALPTISSDQLAMGLAPTTDLLAPVSPATDDPVLAQNSGEQPTRTPSQANLLAYMPDGELVTVLIRFDRLRGTEWDERTAAVLAPMPDSRALLGNRKVTIADIFSTLIISSPSPRDVAETTVIARSDKSNREIRTFLDHPGVPVTWTGARGGALGKRRQSRLVAPHDQRVFLMPYPGWVVLTRPRNLGALVKPAAGELDSLQAAPADTPRWLAAVPAIEGETGQDTGPAVVVTIARVLPETWKAPYLGDVIGEMPTPDRVTLALEVTDKGFFVRGTLSFASVELASEFVGKAKEAKKNFVSTITGRAMLSQVKAYNAARGLSFAQNKEKVGYATSISVADARAVMDFAAVQTRNFFLSGYGPPPADKSPADKSAPKK